MHVVVNGTDMPSCKILLRLTNKFKFRQTEARILNKNTPRRNAMDTIIIIMTTNITMIIPTKTSK